MKRFLVALVSLCLLASTTVLASPASATGGYTSSTVNNCPASHPYYKVSYTGYATCSRYP